MFYFVRHGETDYTERGAKIYQGHGTNLAPLSETGIGQIEHVLGEGKWLSMVHHR